MTATLLLLLMTPGADLRPELIIVQGAGGTDEYAAQFSAWCDTWEAAGARAETTVTRIGGVSDKDRSGLADREQLAAALKKAFADSSRRPLWLVLIGHGTHDGREARFNLSGPDFTDEWLQKELEPCQRPLAVVCCFSSSSPFLNRLSKSGRSVITATRSGAERNFSRFGGFLAEAVTTVAAPSANDNNGESSEVSVDLDKDGQVSLLEAFLYAAQRTEQFYADEQRLATEHPLVDDNGDQRGTPADWFHGIRPTKAPAEGALDGLLASQQVLIPSDRERQATAEFVQKRDALEQQLASLRKRRKELAEDDYYGQLEPLMVQLARLYSNLSTDESN